MSVNNEEKITMDDIQNYCIHSKIKDREYFDTIECKNFKEELKVALNAVYVSCQIAHSLQTNLKEDEKLTKKDSSPVTIGDVSVQTAAALCILMHQNAHKNTHTHSFNTQLLAEEDPRTLPPNLLSRVSEEVSKVFSISPSSPSSPPDGNLSSLPSNKNIISAQKVIDIYKKTCIADSVFARNKKEKEEKEKEEEKEKKEEEEEKSSYWVLDPIDGTKGFLRGEQYAIALAYVHRGIPVLGVLGCPNIPHDMRNAKEGNRGCIFFATKNDGAKVIKMEVNSDGVLQIRKSVEDIRSKQTGDIRAVRLLESYEPSHSDQKLSAEILKQLGSSEDPIRMDSQVKYALVSQGYGDLILRFPRAGYKENVWDHCAGTVIIQEAGGVVTHADGSPLDYRRRKQFDNQSGVVVSGCRAAHAAVLDVIKQTQNKNTVH